MNYHKTITLKDGRTCILRNGTAEDGQALLDIFNLTHAQTDFLLTYPEESTHIAQQEADYLARKTQSADEIEILQSWMERSSARPASAALTGKKKPDIARSLGSARIRRTGARRWAGFDRGLY